MEHSAEFSMRLMNAAAINRRRGLGRLLRGALLLAGFAASAGTCGWGTAHDRSFASPLDWAMLMLTSGGAGFFGAFVLWLAFVRPLMALLHLVPEDDAWLAESESRELDELCEEEPGLVPYRDRVRAANRGFTCGESDAMFAWAREQEWLRRDAEVCCIQNAGAGRAEGETRGDGGPAERASPYSRATSDEVSQGAD